MDYFNQRLIAILTKFRDELRTLADRLSILSFRVQQQTSAVNKANDTAQKQYQSQPPVMRAELHVPEAEKTARKRPQIKKQRLQYTRVALEVLTLAAVIWYACEARKQRVAMDKTFGQVQQQTTLMRQQIVGTQAAFLQFEIRDPDPSTGGLPGGVHNVGMVTATDVHVRLQVTRQEFETDGSLKTVGTPLIFDDTPNRIKGSGTWPEFFYPHIWNVPWIHTENPSIIRETWPKDWPGHDLTEARGLLTYVNGFGEPISKDVCLELLPRFNIKIQNGTMSIGGMYPCENFRAGIPIARETWEKAKH